MRHQYGISTLIPETSFCGETSGGIAKLRLFSQAIKYVDIKCLLIMCREAILCDDKGISTDSNSYIQYYFCKKYNIFNCKANLLFCKKSVLNTCMTFCIFSLIHQQLSHFLNTTLLQCTMNKVYKM